jgi:hypothetical protein
MFVRGVDVNPVVEEFQEVHKVRIARFAVARQDQIERLFLFRRMALMTLNLWATGYTDRPTPLPVGCGAW